MEDDDRPVGRVLSRRRALAVFGAAGMTFTAVGTAVATNADAAAETATTPSCVAKPEMTEGPYFVDEGLNRSDLRVDTSDGSVVTGAKFHLVLHVLQLSGSQCKPLPGATVDIWHCDAAGVYSDIAAEGTTGKNYLRGYQVSNRGGIVKFTTILPGWYQGRTVHTHVKIRTTGTDGNAYEFTSQLFFAEDFKAAYLAKAPYAAKGTPDTTNDTDMHYADIGDQMLLTPKRTRDGYEAAFAIALDLSDTAVGADDSFQTPGGPGGTPPTGTPPTASPSA
ncbi:twin-arginine translocation pathway signal protein [Kribbella speibonae]|uniref:Twin-arginine translocation pathway signal protein n=1 Tax=Kribbella speibonae TaxID=1572660 RepID=A0ABY1ZT57_9ACTN|nr:twin-arginine translocation pathway signal protein [Kribbella speibonae]TCC16673.1 twin-arginine translocation pathway signal protein [Kribbella speibonae]